MLKDSPDSRHTETEIKLRVADLEAVRVRLEALGASLHIPRVLERNIRYDDPNGAFEAAGRVLRLRQDNAIHLTYKEPGTPIEHGATTRTEIEFMVSDLEAADLLLQRLGFNPIWRYEKYRTTYTLNHCEILLDEMPIGNFIEIEGAAADIGHTLAQLALDSKAVVGESYAALYKRVCAYLGIPVLDLTFDNFKDRVIPEAAFNPPE